jgi:hypothetical protein
VCVNWLNYKVSLNKRLGVNSKSCIYSSGPKAKENYFITHGELRVSEGERLAVNYKSFICSFQCFHQFSLFLLNNIPINGAGQGGSPVWNEKITFRVEYPGQGDQYKLILKIMDKDTFSTDDFIGQAT